MSKPGKVLKALCKKLGVRLTVKRGQKRVYKSVAVLKDSVKEKLKKKKKVKRKRRRKFGDVPIDRRKNRKRKAETRRRSDLYNVPSRDLPYIEDRAAKKYLLERQRKENKGSKRF